MGSEEFQCTIGSIPDKTQCILTYDGSQRDILLNYALVAVNLCICAKVIHGHSKFFQQRAATALAFVIAFQIILCLVLGCSGISIIWCSMAGWILTQNVMTKMTQFVLMLNLVAILYYWMVAEMITTVAHGCALILGAGLSQLVHKSMDDDITTATTTPPLDDDATITMAKPSSRDCITCDGPNCTSRAPQKRCSKCHTVFYCSVACQKKHWKEEHKNYCIDIHQMKLNQLTLGDGEMPQVGGELNNTKDGTTDCCAICLGDDLKDPYVLPSCGHAFCFGCLAEWQRTIKNDVTASLFTTTGEKKETKLNCPACRAETPDVEDAILQRARLLASRANNRKTTLESAKTKLRREALAELEQLESFRKGRPPVEQVVLIGDVQAHCQRLATRSEILLELKEPEKAKKDLDWLLDLCKLAAKNRNEFTSMIQQGEELMVQGREDEAERLSEQMDEYTTKHNLLSMQRISFNVFANMGRAEEMMENWLAAKLIYFEMMNNMDNHTSATPPQQRMMFMGLCRCAYHLGRYDKALAAGDAALQMNRHFPFVHQYIALSQKAMGNLKAAKVTMTRALIYEAPWDDQHHERLLELYREIVGEDPSEM